MTLAGPLDNGLDQLGSDAFAPHLLCYHHPGDFHTRRALQEHDVVGVHPSDYHAFTLCNRRHVGVGSVGDPGVDLSGRPLVAELTRQVGDCNDVSSGKRTDRNLAHELKLADSHLRPHTLLDTRVADMTASASAKDLIQYLASSSAALTASVRQLDDSAMSGPSLLPDWTRGHVVTHLAQNAEALTRLLLGAKSGRPLSMYTSRRGRDADIEHGAERPAAVIVDHFILATEMFEAGIAITDDWSEEAVFHAVGGAFTSPAAEVLLMRLREVEIHHVDLDADYDFTHTEASVQRLLLDDAVERFSGRIERPIELVIGGTLAGTISGSTQEEPVRVDVAAGEMLSWLTGRSVASSRLPALPSWG